MCSVPSRLIALSTGVMLMLMAASPAAGGPCVVPDNGTGTVTLPPEGCEYLSPDEVHEIINGLPTGTTIELAPIHKDFICREQTSLCSMTLPPGECEDDGGSLGGQFDCFESYLELELTGTGELAGYFRHLSVPIACEVHTGPRTPGEQVQDFSTVMYRLQGELLGDPDFDELRVTAGSDFGLPSPGHTTLTQLPSGDFAVDSFFDITYQIEFEGAPGSVLDGYAGTTQASLRMETGFQDTCGPLPDGSACMQVVCPDMTDACQPRCMKYDPATGQTTVIDCQCRGVNECHVEKGLPSDSKGDACIVADNGTGTVTLPPAGCEYLSPQQVHEIINGLPAGTTIELDPIHKYFICQEPTSLCSMTLPSGECEDDGGSLGGQFDCFESYLELDLKGTGELAGYSRYLSVPIACEVHTGPRNPGDPVQDFNTVMYRLAGELFGDPDFCTFRVTGGSDFDLPGPGHTTLTQLPSGNFAVDSFFDITYQIEFEGCPGSILDGYSGTTTASLRMETGFASSPPACVGGCPTGEVCQRTETVNPDGTIDVCCDCVAEQLGYAIEFSLDIGSDVELSDPNADGDEGFDPGDVYIWQGLPVTPPQVLGGRDGFKDDQIIFGNDPPPNPPDPNTPPLTRVPVGQGSISMYPQFFDLDGHDQIDTDLREYVYPNEPLSQPVPQFASQCIHPARFLAVSFDDDQASGWPANDVPVTVPSPMGGLYGMTGPRDEVIGVNVAAVPVPSGWTVYDPLLIAQNDARFSEVIPAEEGAGGPHGVTWSTGVLYWPSMQTSPQPGDDRAFLYSSAVTWWQATFNNPSTSLSIQLIACDTNDGWADIFVDGVLAFSYNSYHASYTDVMITVEGLAYTSHTIKIQTRAGGGDVSLDYVAQPAVPTVTPYTVTGTYPIADELTVHRDMAPNPDCGEKYDDDVDSLDVVREEGTINPCEYWLYSPDHEANMGLDPGGIYQVFKPAPTVPPLQVIDEAIHLGLNEDTDIDAFELVWMQADQTGTMVLALLFSVDDDDPLTSVNESGGRNPNMIYYSFLNGVSFPLLDQPLDDDVDALTNWVTEMPSPVSPAAPTIMAWRSVRNHTNVGPLAIVLDPLATDGLVVSESRQFGIQQIEVDFSEAIQVVANAPLQAVDANGGIVYPVNGWSLLPGNQTLVLNWNAGVLPDRTCYVIDLACCVISQSSGMWPGGDTDCMVRGLEGDTSGSATGGSDGNTNLIDAADVKSRNGSVPGPGTAQYDGNTDGAINLIDFAMVKGLNGNSASCP